jgi:two-component system, NarL family, sensor histidine kinase UhpB
VPIVDTSGRFLGYRGGSRDVTEAVLAERALNEARAEQLAHQAHRVQAESEKLDLLRRLVNAQEEERLRIARELHDQVGQDLTGLSLGLKSLEATLHDEAGRGTLRWLQSLAVQMGENLHRTAWELRPTSLEDIGLVHALETYIGDWSERFGIQVDFHATGLDGPRLPAELETVAYRVAQEALTNVLKHAAARTVSLVLERHVDWLQIIVEDDGRGFDPEAAPAKGRLGLAGIRERVALMGGTLTIDSSPAGGATLYVRLPLTGETAARRGE